MYVLVVSESFEINFSEIEIALENGVLPDTFSKQEHSIWKKIE